MLKLGCVRSFVRLPVHQLVWGPFIMDTSFPCPAPPVKWKSLQLTQKKPIESIRQLLQVWINIYQCRCQRVWLGWARIFQTARSLIPLVKYFAVFDSACRVTRIFRDNYEWQNGPHLSFICRWCGANCLGWFWNFKRAFDSVYGRSWGIFSV